MLDHVLRAFDLLINSGELGNADSRNLNTLSPHLDTQAEIGRAELADLLFSGSKDKDGACRSFLSRLKAGAVQAAEEAEQNGKTEAAAVFRSLTVARIKAKGGAPRLRFSAEAPKELPQVMGRANRDYLPEEYLPGKGCKPEEMDKLRQQELRRRQVQAAEKQKPLCCLLEGGRKELYEDEYIPAKGELKRVCTASERHLRAADEEQITTREALADMLDWLKDDKSCLYALLGDYGMGKTFTCRIFAQRLAERCQHESNLPKPVYLDLRDVPTFVTVNGVTRQPTLEEMLETVLRLNGQAEAYTAKELIEAAQQGKLLCIFDGLDEKLVFYTADMQSQFLNELLRVFSYQDKKTVYLDLQGVPPFVTMDGEPRQPVLEETLEIALRLTSQEKKYTANELVEAAKNGGLLCFFKGLDKMLVSYPAKMRSQFLNELLIVFPQDNPKVKIIISCRSHHFETLRQMDGFLLGLNRSGLRSSDYRALQLLPFSSEQILALLTKLLGDEEAKRLFDFIENEAYLKDLAERPFLLRQLSRLLPQLQELKSQGKPINAAGFYQAMIEDCLNRDNEKNLIKTRHKQVLLMDLAATFWHNSIQKWQIDRLNDWFCAWLYKQPELASQYSGLDGLSLEKDLRTSTLLVRFGEHDFVFSHSSMQEYFLSKWLIRQLQEGRELQLQQPISWLTRQFLFDQLVLLKEQELEQVNKGLAVSLARPWSVASELALEIIINLAQKKQTLPELREVDMREADLSGRQLRGLRGKTLLIDQAKANESQWLDCHFQHIEIGQGNINGSLWRDCSWQEFNTVAVEAPPCAACLTGEKGTGSHGSLPDITLANCHGNTPLYRPHIFPSDNRNMAESFCPEEWQQHHGEAIQSCCFSPDGSRILFAASDKTLKLWDMTGRCIQTFQGHEGIVQSCCFSPDGSRILSASWDATLKLWDMTGRCTTTFQGYDGWALGCCFSPDGSCVLSASFDSTLRLWDLEGCCLQAFQGHEGRVRGCCFSPDGSRILSAASDKTLKLWNVKECYCIQTIQGHEEVIRSCCFSPDGSRILSAASDKTLKLWDVTGQCLRTFEGHKGEVNSCCFSPDGTFIISVSWDGTLRLWLLDGTVERISAAWEEQWYTAFFNNNQLEKIIGTEMSWKMAHFAKDGKTWTLDQTGCFEWVPAQY